MSICVPTRSFCVLFHGTLRSFILIRRVRVGSMRYVYLQNYFVGASDIEMVGT